MIGGEFGEVVDIIILGRIVTSGVFLMHSTDMEQERQEEQGFQKSNQNKEPVLT